MTAFPQRVLGRTGLRVSPIGIGGGAQIESSDVLYAFDRGINYYFYSSDLHHFAYRKSAEALKQLCGSGSAVRGDVVLATVSYMNDPEKILGVLYDQFKELGTDYVDVFHWGWITERSDCQALFECAAHLRDGGPMAEQIKRMLGRRERAEEIGRELQRKGMVRFIGASFHARSVARQWTAGLLDVLMLRYNIAHLGAENDVFPALTGRRESDPGIVAFNVGHAGPRSFDTAPPGYPAGYPVPSIPDCYRFALSNPHVDLVLAGLSNRTEIDAALAAMERGPMSARELELMRRYGAVFSNKARVRVPAEGARTADRPGIPG